MSANDDVLGWPPTKYPSYHPGWCIHGPFQKKYTIGVELISGVSKKFHGVHCDQPTAVRQRKLHLYCVRGKKSSPVQLLEKTSPFSAMTIGVLETSPLTSGIAATFNSCLTNLDPHNSGFNQENRTVKVLVPS